MPLDKEKYRKKLATPVEYASLSQVNSTGQADPHPSTMLRSYGAPQRKSGIYAALRSILRSRQLRRTDRQTKADKHRRFIS